MAGAPYGNPAHDAEELAKDIVQGWVGARGTVSNLGSTHEPDLRIDYMDGRLGIGEVTTHMDQRVAAMWAEAYKSGQPQMVELPSGFGTWSAQLVAGSNIPRLQRDVAVLDRERQKSGDGAVHGVRPLAEGGAWGHSSSARCRVPQQLPGSVCGRLDLLHPQWRWRGVWGRPRRHHSMDRGRSVE